MNYDVRYPISKEEEKNVRSSEHYGYIITHKENDGQATATTTTKIQFFFLITSRNKHKHLQWRKKIKAKNFWQFCLGA